MIKYFCDRCGAEIPFDDVVKMEMSRTREWAMLGEFLKFDKSVLCPKCITEFGEFMQEGNNNGRRYRVQSKRSS